MRPSANICRQLAVAGAAAVLSACASVSSPPSTGIDREVRHPQMGSEGRTLARADSTWNAGEYAESRPLYQSVLDMNPNNSRAVFRIATLVAWDNHLDQAIQLYKLYIELEPADTEGRLALARAYAWSGRYVNAVAIYDSVIAGDATYRDAILGRAQTLAWAGRMDESLATYERWRAAHPGDNEAGVAYARVLSWDGRLEDAEALYGKLASSGDANAQKGLARVRAWRGNLQDSETAWRQLLERRPKDAEALTGLAEVLRWQGREVDAADALEMALRSDPTYGDARALLRWVRADMRPSVTLTGTGENDSDNNRSTVLRMDYSARAPWHGSIGAGYTDRSSNFSAVNSRSEAGRVFARWRKQSWDFRVDAGMTHHSSTFVPPTSRSTNLWSAGFSAGGNLSRSLNIGATVSHAPFDETALLIANGISTTELAGEVGLLLPARLKISAAASQAKLTGGASDNTRLAYSSSLRWAYNRRLSVAIGGRQFGYDKPSVDGYFAPKRYTLGELSGRAAFGGQLGWNADADVGLGRQQIDFFGSSATPRVAQRAALSAGYRIDPAREITLSGGYANVAQPGQTTSTEYKAYTVSLRARLGL
ncbi:MAG TPA: tetratricopeptide repeat protein [Gemmatimonadaceae bacterium]|nr:tetratricopeptide repeat protein [Gemmatimonadaceae bacterium]